MGKPTENAVKVIEYLMKEKDQKQVEIERRCGLPSSSINKWCSGIAKNALAENIGKLLEEYKDVRAEFVMRGSGPMLFSQIKEDDNQQELQKCIDKITKLEKELEEKTKLIDELTKKLTAATDYIDATQKYLSSKK